jgi:polar amino acid transport system substrate-binding protein
MKRTTRLRGGVIVIAAISAVTLAGCSTAASGSDPTSTSSAGTLRSEVPSQFRGGLVAASQADIPPFNFVDDAGNQSGLDGDLVDAISKELGVKITLNRVTFENLILGLDSGKYDFVADTTVTTPREQKYDMVAYLDGSDSTATLASAKALGSDETALCGVSTAIVTGEVTGPYVTSTLDPKCTAAGKQPVEAHEYKDFSSAILALKSKSVDAGLLDTATLGYFLKSGNGDDVKVNGPKQLIVSPGAYSFLKAQDGKLAAVVQKAVQRMIASGEYSKIFKKYGLSDLGVEKTGPVLNPTVG